MQLKKNNDCGILKLLNALMLLVLTPLNGHYSAALLVVISDRKSKKTLRVGKTGIRPFKCM